MDFKNPKYPPSCDDYFEKCWRSLFISEFQLKVIVFLYFVVVVFAVVVVVFSFGFV